MFDPFGNPLGTSDIPDNSAGALDYGWHGQQQRPLEHQAGLLSVIEMGARQYSPLLGRFLEIDPIEGGTTNDYTYVDDPTNQTDLNGNICWGWKCIGRKVYRSVRKSAKFARRSARFVSRHWRTATYAIAIGTCIAASFGACAGAVAAGFAARSAMTFRALLTVMWVMLRRGWAGVRVAA